MNFFKTIQVRATIGFLFSAIIFLLPLVAVMAATTQTGFDGTTQTGVGGNSSTGNGSSGTYKLDNPLGVSSFCDLIVVILNAALVIGIPIAVLFIVYAGFKFILARGNPAGLSEARSNFFNTLIGIAIFVGASLIAQVIVATLKQLGVSVGSCIG